MKNPFVFAPGGVVSADIAIPDHEKVVNFFAKVLTTGESPLWREDLMNNHGQPIIGLGPRTPEYENLPVQWMPHFQVADVAASAQRSVELGGKELVHGKTDEGMSQWAVLSDPNGAAFGIIPVVTGQAEDQPNPTGGRISWLSLTTPDVAACSDFYQQVIGWHANKTEAPSGDSQFEMQIDEQTSAAEIIPSGNSPNDIPHVWLIHIPVADLSESLRLVRENGGEIVQAPAGDPFAVIRDPVGVHIAICADSQ